MMQHQITLAQAIDYTTCFRENPGKDMPYSEIYLGSSVKALLDQNRCHSFRIYLGRKADNRICSVLVAVDENGFDMLPPGNVSAIPENEGIILQDAFQCPPLCPPSSPLNG